MTALSLILLLVYPAKASTGPWVLSAGDNSVYLGVESQRFDHLALSTGSGSEDVLQVSDGT